MNEGVKGKGRKGEYCRRGTRWTPLIGCLVRRPSVPQSLQVFVCTRWLTPGLAGSGFLLQSLQRGTKSSSIVGGTSDQMRLMMQQPTANWLPDLCSTYLRSVALQQQQRCQRTPVNALGQETDPLLAEPGEGAMAVTEVIFGVGRAGERAPTRT